MPPQQKQQGSGGSALKRLKSSLHAAGVVGQQAKASKSKKDRKRGNPLQAGKNDVQDKLKLIREEFNPFETKVNHTKFDIIGRKVKGAKGRPVVTKQIGEENRKKTLLVEMKNKNHAGGIIDRRFGENNPHLTPEEKMLERFTKEKQKSAKSKTSLFNLEDDDVELTHYGKSLAEMDDFDDSGLALSDDEENGQLDKNMVSRMHFGGFEEEEAGNDEGRPKSRAEVMKEIIAKSKSYKYERQLAKDEDEALRRDLDDELSNIRGLLSMNKDAARKPLPSQNALFAKSEFEKAEAGEAKEPENAYEDYDKLIHELAGDRRAMATDRTKTEEEIALEEKEKLEKAERARKRRMEGLDSESEDESSRKHGHKRRKAAVPQGDDLDDDYLEDLEEEAQRLGKGLTLADIQNGTFAEESDEEDEDDQEESDDDDEDEGEDDEDEEEEDEEEEESDYDDINDDELPDFDAADDMNEFNASGSIAKSAKKKASTKGEAVSATREIPYTFECPSTHAEFLEIMDGLAVEDAVTVVKRIRILYNVKLAPENKAKMTQFLGIVVDHLAYIASTVSPIPNQVLEGLIKHAFGLAQSLPAAATQVFVEKLKQMHDTLGKKMSHQGSAFPDVEEIVVLRCLGKIFPTSDKTHAVVTPAMLLMCQALGLSRIRNLVDVGRGLFLALLFHEYQTISKRFVPEVLNFLQRALVLLSPSSVFDTKVPGSFPMPDDKTNIHISDVTGGTLDTIPSVSLDQLGVEDAADTSDEFRLSLILGILRLMERYLQLYASTPAFVEVFEPMQKVVSDLSNLPWHKDIESQLKLVSDRLERQIKFAKDKRAKTAIRMQHHRPIPIAQHVPKFEAGYSLDRHYDPNQERSEFNKLKAQYKKERKGAIRELRKDNMFLAREKARMQKEKDQEYKKMINGVMNILQSDQAEKNRLEKLKKK